MSGTVVCDLDGVVYLSSQAVEGGSEALGALRDAGFRILFCTNNSRRTPIEVSRRIHEVSGFRAEPDQVVSSAMAAAHLVAGECSHALVVGDKGIDHALREVGITVTEEWSEADLVVVGLDRDFSYERLANATRAVLGGARLVATNDDATFPTPDGQLPGAGAMVAALEKASGVKAEVAGKPFAPMRRLLRERIGEGQVWIVGDRPETDLAMGHAEGWTTVLVLSGVTTNTEGIEPAPDHIIASLAGLPDLLPVA